MELKITHILETHLHADYDQKIESLPSTRMIIRREVMDWLSMERWPPYAVGIGIGILSWATFLFSDRPIGCSTAFSRTSGMLERLIREERVREKAYYRKFAPGIDWEWMLVLGIFFGALISATLSASFHRDRDLRALALEINPAAKRTFLQKVHCPNRYR